VEYGTRLERVVSDAEQEITNAIIKAVEGQQKKVYFVQARREGHGQRDEQSGYNTISQALTRDNYTVEKLVLAQKGGADDAAVVVVAGPTADFLPGEIEMLRRYWGRAAS